MKKLLCFLWCCYAIFSCGSLYAKTLTVSHISVTALPVLGNTSSAKGAVFMTFRCTNHTARVLPLELVVIHGSYRDPGENELKKTLRLPGLSTSEVSFCFPRTEDKYGKFHWDALSDSSIVVSKGGNSFYSGGNSYKGLASPSFRPDLFEYLFGPDIKKAPLPVKEWPADSRAYASPGLVILDSGDKVPPAVNEALRLAAARGGRILVLVVGDAPWPADAGVEIRGIPFEEKIGFGSRVVMRISAVDSNPKWKEFTRKKHAEGTKGKWRSQYKKIQWCEKALYPLLNGVRMPNATHPALAVPPIPLTLLTVIMCCFVVIIGPVNFLMLKKFRAEIWSFVTIPAASLIFTGAVIVGVFLKEGFSSRGKGIVETVLDQRTGVAAARGGFSLYSPLSVGKFHFNSEDVLNFINSGKVQGKADRDLTFSPSLLRTRMTFDYGVSRSGYCSEKLAFSEKNGTLEVVNGLGVRVDSLYVSDGTGKFFKLDSPLEPGARAALYEIPKLPALTGHIAKNCYRASVATPFFISPGIIPGEYEHKQTISGRWR